MLTCIACSKHLEVDDDERATPRVKSLTAQIKDMALKFSSVYRQCKPGTSSRKGSHPFADLDAPSESLNYGCQRTVSCSSTPAWDFHTSSNRDLGVLHDSSRTHNVCSLTGEAAGLDSLSCRSGEFILVQEDEPREWMAQVEPGVLITFVSLPQGGNDLKRIRFSREMFNKIQAQRWWGENYDRIMELYNVQRFSRQAVNLPTPRSEDEQRDSMSRMGSAHDSPATQHLNRETYPRNFYRPPGKPYYAEPTDAAHQFDAGSTSSPRFPNLGWKKEAHSVDASRTTTSSRDEASVSLSNASDMENEWVEQDEPGVYITIRALPDGTRELRRVRFRYKPLTRLQLIFTTINMLKRADTAPCCHFCEAVKDLVRLMLRSGGKRTGKEYKLNIFE